VKTRFLLAVAAILCVAGGTGSHAEAPKKPAPAAPEFRPIPITTGRTESRAVQRSVETTGSMLAWEEVILNTAIAGTVAKLRALLGDRVQAGQVVAELDARELGLTVDQMDASLRAAVDQVAKAKAQAGASEANLRQVRESVKTWEANQSRARVALEEGRINLERTRQLFERELIPARDLDSARTQYESMLAQHQAAEVEMSQYPDRVRVAEAQVLSDQSAVRVSEAEVKQREATLGLARKKLGDAVLRAPITGAIAKRHVNVGEYLRENTPVFTIVALDPVKYSGTIPERFAPDVRPGQALQLSVEAYGGRTFTGQITRVAPAVDVQTRTIELEGKVPNGDGKLRPGFFTRGVVITGRDAAAVFAPADAVAYLAGITKVFVVGNGKVEERLIKTGPRQGNLVEITSGVKAGEVVATSNLGQLFNGAPVSVLPGK
jgi:RND family efflux transporter MFP subunit